MRYDFKTYGFRINPNRSRIASLSSLNNVGSGDAPICPWHPPKWSVRSSTRVEPVGIASGVGVAPNALPITELYRMRALVLVITLLGSIPSNAFSSFLQARSDPRHMKPLLCTSVFMNKAYIPWSSLAWLLGRSKRRETAGCERLFRLYQGKCITLLRMESLWKLVHLLGPSHIALILTAIAVSYESAFRALNYVKEMERNFDLSEASVTLDRSQALMLPVVSSCSLLMLFYFFSSVSQILTVFIAIASTSSLYFCLFPYIAQIRSRFGLADPFISQCCSNPFTRIQGLLMLLCIVMVIMCLVSGNWILNNLLGISLCIAFVSHIRLPNIKICAMLFVCVFVYDIFWVFNSERFFGANVMVSLITRLASNPVHTAANSLSLPGLQLITKKVNLPVKIILPRNLLGVVVPGYAADDFIMLGLGDTVNTCPTCEIS
ncbi:Signal peptide peptidase-like 1 [Capsicum chinense]|nr:Signal peptide peptidase-like 1 [Capsicum chinense]